MLGSNLPGVLPPESNVGVAPALEEDLVEHVALAAGDPLQVPPAVAAQLRRGVWAFAGASYVRAFVAAGGAGHLSPHFPRDRFDDLRDDGIAEASQTVHPTGNPMSHSTQSGFNCPGESVPALHVCA